MYPHTGDLFLGLVRVSIVLCIHTLATCFWVLYVCQLCCISTHWRPVFGSCRCVTCVYPHTGDLFSGHVGVSIVLCFPHTGNLFSGLVGVLIVLCIDVLWTSA